VKNIGLRFATGLLIVLSSLAVAQAQAPAPLPAPPTVAAPPAPPLVYRYDLLAPWNNGQGIFEIGFQRDPNASRDIARHIELESTDHSSALISTSSSFDYVQSFASRWLQYDDINNTTYYIYDIIPGPNFVDVAQTYRRTVANMADSYARTTLSVQPGLFTNEREFSAIVQIPRERIVRARLFNMNGQQIAELQNPNYDPSLTPEIHPDTYPLGAFRNYYYAYNLPGRPVVVVTGDFVCETLAAYQVPRDKRSTDSADPDSTDSCAGVTQTLQATIPLSTPAGFGNVANQTVSVYPGDYRQWVDVNGDGYADFCRLTKASNPADPTKPVQMSCLINDHENFLTSIDGSSSYNIELNLELTNPGVMRDESVQTGDLAWLTGSGRQIGQYCRVRNDYNLACTGIY
jgi:hypothetical protein